MGRNRLGYVSEDPTTSVVYVNGTQTGYGVATGGSSSSITVGGQAYTLLTFTSTGTLTVSTAGLFDVLSVGGGAGSTGYSNNGAGGGAGGVAIQTIYLSANATVTIGGGGTGATIGNASYGSTGSPSGIGSQPDIFGAPGGMGFVNDNGSPRGSVASISGAVAGKTNSGINNMYGYKGGDSSATNNGGGGGGAAAVGGNGTTNTGGVGGAGYDASTFRGESAATTRYAGGGGGGGASTNGAGGVGGGGGPASNGTANTGGGGGSGSGTNFNGGSGILLVRFKV